MTDKTMGATFMSRTVTQGFNELSSRLEITDLQASTVSARQQNVRDAVKKGFVVWDDFLTGSYMRNTMISPLSDADIDIFFVLSSEYYKVDGQQYILDKVRDVLKKTYTTPQVSRNGQAVTIFFKDFEVDVVPAFRLQGGGYFIADSGLKRWISTDPKKHIDLWSQANKAHDYTLIPFLKMLKAWNKENGRSLRSFHLECLSLKVLEGYAITYYPSALSYFFGNAQAWIKRDLPDPAGVGYNPDVGKYLDTDDKINDVVNRLETAYSRAKKAEESAAREKIEDAYYYWRLIFDDYFPAYG